MSEGISFKDADGREWHPKINARVVSEYERLAGSGLFEAFYRLFEEGDLTLKELEGAELRKEAFALGRRLFGSVSDLSFLLFESCRSAREEPGIVRDGMGEKLTLEEFREGIRDDVVPLAIITAMNLLMSFCPSGDEWTGGENRPPKGPGPGETSSRPQQSPE